MSAATTWVTAWDHPRIRGEHAAAGVPSATACGSSPHTRGARGMPRSPSPWTRIIPAYAGSTKPPGVNFRGVSDHPRIRGEHSMSFREVRTLIGSSPHTRGALLAVARRWLSIYGSSPHTRGARLSGIPRCRCRRIIPAYAGSTSGVQVIEHTPSDHPRIRGEHAMVHRLPWMARGSSPHTRGARRADPRQDRESRIIPAYAGSTYLS